MARRTQKQIEADFHRIYEAVNSTNVTSLQDLAEKMNLSVAEVKTSLSKHPQEMEEILEHLRCNKRGIKPNTQVTEMENSHCFENGYVIDASICGSVFLMERISEICKKGNKIIITSITISELESLQKSNDTAGIDARHILAMAAENEEDFIPILIDETLETPDDCIVKCCAEHKEQFTLMTSDKTMALKARMYGVKTEYLKQNDYVCTLFTAKRIKNHLCISDFDTECRSIEVISRGTKINRGVHNLHPGDDVYIVTRKNDYLTFAHYQMISVADENNCMLVYSARIYEPEEISDLPNAEYRRMVQDFRQRISL